MSSIYLDTSSIESYRTFLAVKGLPRYRFSGHMAEVPEEYMASLGLKAPRVRSRSCTPSDFLFDYQRDISALAIRKQKFAIFARCGLGKGQPPDAKVLTPSGWQTIGSLIPGDKVIASSGQAATVLGIYPKPEQDTYRMHFSDGASFVVDQEHLHICRTNHDRQQKRPWRVLSTADLLPPHRIRYGSTNKSRKYDIPVVSDVEFNAFPLPLDPYLIGVLLGDGYLKDNVSVSSADEEIISAVKRLLPSGVLLTQMSKYDWRIVTGSTGPHRSAFRSILLELGILGHLAATKRIPRIYLFATPAERLALLRGLMDTDGYIMKCGTCQFYSVSPHLASGVLHLVRSLGGIPTTGVKQTSCNGKPGQPCHVVTFSLATHNPFLLSRKAILWNPAPRDNGRWIDRIEFEARQPTVCIAVDSPDQSYVTEHFIVTHNTLCIFEFARHVLQQAKSKKVLIVSPLNVVPQTIGEADTFYGSALRLEQLSASTLPTWLRTAGGGIGIVNYEAIKGMLDPKRLSGIILDESSCMKSSYGAWGQRLIALGRGLPWKLCLTGTPAPNDRIEYANHAVFLDRFPTVNSFLARYFVNRGQTDNRWELKPHALRPFYRSLSDWCIFLNDPATYGWKDNVGTIPPIHVHIHDVPMTPEQRTLVSSISGDLYGSPGGITSRSKLAQLAKGRYVHGTDPEKNPDIIPGLLPDARVPTNKPAYIRDLIASWPEESTILWVQFNHEQDTMEAILPGAASLRGSTPDNVRIRLIDDFKSGRTKTIISKPKILGFGLNLQIATRHVFNGLADSYEQYHQCLMRSNRVGSTRDLHAHIPLTEIERPMTDSVLRKADRVDQDTCEQEFIFKEVTLSW